MERAVDGGLGMRALATACVAAALVAGVMATAGSGIVSAQQEPGCEVNDLGTLGSDAGSTLEAGGRWTTRDCDSRFRIDSDAHSYRFQVAAAGRVRVDLTSDAADSHLYLLSEDGNRITDDDDSGAGLDSRMERDLVPGAYLIEATTTGGRGRGPADFALAVSRVEGCEPVHLGTLEPGLDLTASDSWTLDTCGSRFVVEHPAHGYSFQMSEAGRVRIDLESENGDPVVSLLSLLSGVIAANDDGGGNRNARVERYLSAGVYFIEATTYLERDYQPLHADFTLTVHLVDEEARQRSSSLKIEEVLTPAEAIADDPFSVHYRVGNLGGGELPDDGSRAVLYVVGNGVFERLDSISGHWPAGVSYHSGDETATAASASISEVSPFEVTFSRRGPAWVFVAVLTLDANGDEIGFHGLWHNLTVLSGPTFEPVDVEVDGDRYTVSAESDDAGRVTTTVSPEADAEVRAKAVYAAGVRTQLLDGIFARPAIAGLSEAAEPAPASVANPSSRTLRNAFALRYSTALNAAGLARSMVAGEAINPIEVEEAVLISAETASEQYASLAASWRALIGRTTGGTLSFADAVAVQSQLAYAENLISPAVTAGEIVTAARAADAGWEDPAVRAMMAEHASCRPGATALRRALEPAGLEDVDGLLALDAEMRSLRPVHGLAVDSALCAVASVDAANSRFLQSLSIDDSRALRELIDPERPTGPVQAPEPHRLRIIARLGDDGRVEHGVELVGGVRVLPEARFLPADAPNGTWQVTQDVEVQGSPIGRIRARRLAGGRIEMGFISAGGDAITPDIAYLPVDLPEGVWLRSSEIDVPAVTVMDTAG